jgi:hypothetical protein
MTMKPIHVITFACVALAPVWTHAQVTASRREVLRIEATPIGALPPTALTMPASRNHNYWGFRLQGGRREGNSESDLPAFAGGIDFQYRGGSVLGITGGYQKRDCALVTDQCGGHSLFGIKSRINLMTGGQAIGSLIGDYSSTTTIGGEIGFGYAPKVLPGMSACTLDIGAPFTESSGQRIRIATFITPGMVWDMGCSAGGPGRPNYLVGLGLGLQQLANRGLDVYFGVQKIFRKDTGYQVGISVTYIRLP